MRNGDAALIAMLKKMSLVTDSQADIIAVKSRQQGASIDATAVQLGIITEEQLVKALTQECWIPHLKVGRYEIRQKALDVICRDDAVQYDVFPVDRLGFALNIGDVESSGYRRRQRSGGEDRIEN